MRIFHALPAVFFLLISVNTSFGQAKQITRDESLSAFRAAINKARGINQRHISKIQSFADGKLIESEEWQYERDGTDKIHYVHILTKDGKTSRTEEIDIGQARYCKKGDAPWVVQSSPCIGGGAGGSPVNDSTKYSVEKIKLDGKNLNLYSQYTEYKDTFSKNKDTEGLSYHEWKFWIGEDGLMVREQWTRGLIDPKTVKASTIDTFEYDPKIKVEAPLPGGPVSGIGASAASGFDDPLSQRDNALPRILSKPKVTYTENGCQAHFEGPVILRVTFLASGQIGPISVLKAAPYGLTEQAIAAADLIKFEPARIDGNPVTVTKQVEYTFSGC